MRFGIIGRTGPGMRQVVGFGNRSMGGVLLGANLGRAIVTKGHFTVYVCYSVADGALFPNYFGQTFIINDNYCLQQAMLQGQVIQFIWLAFADHMSSMTRNMKISSE